jgi:superfamily I DNA/RNA helicase
MLIGELIPLTLTYSRSNPGLSVLPVLKHVLVDEYQDLNRADQALVRMLAGTGSLLVIGDDNQSIYSFRHANPEGVRTFPAEVAGTVPYKIEECRRCAPNVVEMSNALISHDPDTSRPSPLLPEKTKAPATVNIVQFDSLESEVATIAEYVDRWLASHPDTPPGRVLVLAPRRFVGNAIKDTLIARGRKALSYYFEDELEVDDAAKGFCLLSLIVNPDDRAALRAWIGFGGSELLRRPYARLRHHCETNGVALSAVLSALASGTLSLPHTSALATRWTELQSQLAALKPLTGLSLVNALWPAGNPETASIRALAGEIDLKGVDNSTLLGELREAITQPELPDSSGDIIQVMSLHKSKGLTRDLVVMAGCMAGTLPRVDEDDPAEVQRSQIDEQRRLFYVGMTRGTKELLISSAASLPVALAMRGNAQFSRRVLRNGEWYAVTAFSPFISELGPTAPAPISGAQFRATAGLSVP